MDSLIRTYQLECIFWPGSGQRFSDLSLNMTRVYWNVDKVFKTFKVVFVAPLICSVVFSNTVGMYVQMYLHTYLRTYVHTYVCTSICVSE